MKKSFSKFKLLYLVCFILLIISLTFAYKKTKKYSVNIVTNPTDAYISINNSPPQTNSSPYLLSSNKNSIKVTKAGFETYSADFVVNKSQEITIELKSLVFEDLQNKGLSSGIPSAKTTQHVFLYIDPSSEFLVGISENGVEEIFKSPTKDFEYNHPWITIVPKDSANKIALFNVESQQHVNLRVGGVKTIESASYNPQNNSVYVLGDIDVINRTTKLFVYDKKNPAKRIATTNATDLKLNGDKLFLFEYADAKDLSSLTVYSLEGDVVFHSKANNFQTSPLGGKVVLQKSNQLEIVDFTNSLQPTVIATPSTFVFWCSEEEVCLVKQFSNSSIFEKYNLEGKLISKSNPETLQKRTLYNFIDYSNNVLYAKSADGKIISIILE